MRNADHSVSATSAAEHLDQNRLTFKLMPTLVLSIGILVLLSVGSVLIVNWISDRRIVQEFISRLTRFSSFYRFSMGNLSIMTDEPRCPRSDLSSAESAS